MHIKRYIITGIIVIVAYIFITSFFFIVDETKQVVITQFGRPVGEVIKEAGIHFKPPWQVAHFFEKRILIWDGAPREIQTGDRKYVWVDTTARWRIKNALRFLESVKDEEGAQSKLDDILDSHVEKVIVRHPILEIIRTDTNNKIIDTLIKEKTALGEFFAQKKMGDLLQPIKIGRAGILREIFELSREMLLKEYGIELIDIQIKRINYIEDVRKSVYQRMISDQKQIAKIYRGKGKAKQDEILGQMQEEIAKMESAAYRKAQEIKGRAEAMAIKIYADAYKKSPGFFRLIKTLSAYRSSLSTNTVLILSTRSPLFEYLGKLR